MHLLIRIWICLFSQHKVNSEPDFAYPDSAAQLKRIRIRNRNRVVRTCGFVRAFIYKDLDPAFFQHNMNSRNRISLTDPGPDSAAQLKRIRNRILNRNRNRNRGASITWSAICSAVVRPSLASADSRLDPKQFRRPSVLVQRWGSVTFWHGCGSSDMYL
jgi:hypothetical protein